MKTWQKLRKHPELWERYFVREKVLTAIRRFFFDRGFHEVETPSLAASLPPESYVDVFETTIRSRDKSSVNAYLPTSPEPYLKKLLVAGVGNCFALPKSFRNSEDKTSMHNPEFTILEWYRVEADYTEIMKDCEDLMVFINTYLKRSKKGSGGGSGSSIVYQGKTIDLSSPWERLSVREAFDRYADISLDRVLTFDAMVKLVSSKGYTVRPADDWEVLFDQLFLNEVEPYLGKGKPTILYDYPVQLASLSKKKDDDPRYAERFEFYIEGLELGNAFSELADWKEQKKRFEFELAERKRKGKTIHPVDWDFIEALKLGLPRSGGIAVGVDRLIMLFADVPDIADTLFFPGKEEFFS